MKEIAGRVFHPTCLGEQQNGQVKDLCVLTNRALPWNNSENLALLIIRQFSVLINFGDLSNFEFLSFCVLCLNSSTFLPYYKIYKILWKFREGS